MDENFESPLLEEDVQDIPEQLLHDVFPNLPLTGAEQATVIKKALAFKSSAKSAMENRKNKMRDALKYVKGEFTGVGDLLPTLGDEGTERDAKTNRPQLFYPLAPKIARILYAQIKLTLFPNDEGFFRIKGKNEDAAKLEDGLTEGFGYLLQEMGFTERMGLAIWNAIWSGNSAVYPKVQDRILYEWKLLETLETAFDSMTGEPIIDPETGEPMRRPVLDQRGQPKLEYQLEEIDQEPLPDIEVWNSINFYPDPSQQNTNNSKWGYFDSETKLQTLLDSDLFFNKKQIKDKVRKDAEISNASDSTYVDKRPLSGAADADRFGDTEGNMKLDYIYFPYLKVGDRDFRNITVCLAEETYLVMFHPNLYPRGMNPVAFSAYQPDPESPLGSGPIDNIMEIQRLVNLLTNYKLDVLARIGNRFALKEGTDTTGFFGAGGGVLFCEDPQRDVHNFAGDYAEIGALENTIGVLNAEAQILTGANTPFQGSSNIDFQKTATELQIIQEGAMTLSREAIEHLALTLVQETLERLMYLTADLYKKPYVYRVDDPFEGVGFREVDFRVLRSGDYCVEVTSVNPGQSKQSQIEAFEKLMAQVVSNPQMMDVAYPIMKKIAVLSGIKDFDNIMDQIKGKIQEAQQQAQEQAAQVGVVDGQGQPAIPA